MKLKVDGKNPDYLRLGVQTNTNLIFQDALKRARAWAPKKAKSFTISKFQHTDYHGYPSEIKTGYASFIVEYFSTRKEGKHRVYNHYTGYHYISANRSLENHPSHIG